MMMFIKDKPDQTGITDLWLTKTPCARCSQALIDYFKSHTKPTLHMGHIRHCKRMNNLIKAGFIVKVWKESHHKSGEQRRRERTSSHIKNSCQEIK